VPLEPILGLKRAAVLLLELPQLVVDIKGAAEVRLPQPLAKLRQVAKAVEELLATLLEGLVLCHGGHRSLRRDYGRRYTGSFPSPLLDLLGSVILRRG
jgi:hypothetical protein